MPRKRKPRPPKPRIPLPPKAPKVERDAKKELSRHLCRRRIKPDFPEM
ncbi:MAG: hypothetical protein N3D11_01990 [Candidatus Sumerlaeia bacterium]|nr:hypothetical protein [Candidatus Sumerlaeia bacterium]